MKDSHLGLSIVDVLFFVGMRSRKGELVVESGNNIGTVLMNGGKILQAFSPYSRAIGDLLVEDGLISETELIETLALQKKSNYIPLGGLLLKKGKVTFEVIERLVHEQIRQSIREFQTWNDANFSFLDKEMEPYDRIGLSILEFIPPSTVETMKSFLSAVSS